MVTANRARVLVLATSALDRRALAAAVSTDERLELVAACASPSSARRRLLRDDVDILALEAARLEPEVLAQLAEVASEAGVAILAFEPDEATEQRLARLVRARRDQGRSSPPSRPPPTKRIVAIGCSTGGPEALARLLPRLPADFSMPVLVAQHMPASFTPLLARRLEQRSVLRIHEAADGEPLLPGTVLVAPGDRHLEVDETAAVARLSQEPPENSCRPSVDVLFRSVARALGPRALGLVLTGMGRDGLEGARFLRQAGGEVWVQDETSSVVWGMPGLIHQARLATRVGDLDTLADGLLERARLYRLGSGTTEHARNT